MPRSKPARGNVTLRTVFPEEFCRWLNYELFNVVQWNPKVMRNSAPYRQQYECSDKAGRVLWRIVIKPYDSAGREQGVTFISNNPVIHIRKGLEFYMGSGRLVVTSSMGPVEQPKLEG